ncbi:MAG: hypothetical protein ACR5LD_11875 [Symbiopectobacterium sp.]
MSSLVTRCLEEERKLCTSHFQQQIAESMLAGIKAYFASMAIVSEALSVLTS